VRYRRDAGGRRIGLLPARCKRGLHDLATVGYRAAEHEGVLRVSCTACANQPHPDHAWRLTTSPPTPDAAELDDRPYADLTPQFIERPSAHP
jgi:hypothetical protein